MIIVCKEKILINWSNNNNKLKVNITKLTESKDLFYYYNNQFFQFYKNIIIKYNGK